MSNVLEIGPDTGDIVVAPLAPGEAWGRATLTVSAAPTVDLTADLQTSLPANGGVTWASMDWGAMRQISAVKGTFSPTPAATIYAALKDRKSVV